MKKQFLIGLICSLLSLSAIAEEEKKAPKSVVNDYIELCTIYATEDDISKEELDSYLLNCVNEELKDNGYKEVNSLKDE
jgi:hypothetical protein